MRFMIAFFSFEYPLSDALRLLERSDQRTEPGARRSGGFAIELVADKKARWSPVVKYNVDQNIAQVARISRFCPLPRLGLDFFEKTVRSKKRRPRSSGRGKALRRLERHHVFDYAFTGDRKDRDFAVLGLRLPRSPRENTF